MADRDIVLAVDDSPETLGFLTEALEAAGLTVLIANDGPAALALVDQITPDLILMDAVMPGLDGFETCRRLKAMAALAHLPVIFMTGLADTAHVVEGFSAGGVDYVTKPLVPEQLIARIRVHLANARAAHGARLALDTTGRFLLATDRAGTIRWATPQALRQLAEAVPGIDQPGARLPAAAREALGLDQDLGVPRGRWSFALGARRLDLTRLGQVGTDEVLFRLQEARDLSDEAILHAAFPTLTLREAEVLVWIARGKANRDISDILGISPRTVNKHLEQVFMKLGVENRASAAALAVRALAPRD